MVRRITKTVLLVVMLIGLAQAGPACFGWWPFSSDEKPKTTAVSRKEQKPPSTWEKLTSGTKTFFKKTGQTLGLAKKEPRKPPPVVAAKPPTIQPKAKPASSGLASWFQPKQQEKPVTVKGWLDSTQQVTP